jgi:hypothetical protein
MNTLRLRLDVDSALELIQRASSAQASLLINWMRAPQPPRCAAMREAVRNIIEPSC